MSIYQPKILPTNYTQHLCFIYKVSCSNTLWPKLLAHTSYFKRMVSYENNFPGLWVSPLTDQRTPIADLHVTPKTTSSSAEISSWPLGGLWREFLCEKSLLVQSSTTSCFSKCFKPGKISTPSNSNFIPNPAQQKTSLWGRPQKCTASQWLDSSLIKCYPSISSLRPSLHMPRTQRQLSPTQHWLAGQRFQNQPI